MELRLARMEDLPQLKAMYKAIVAHMERSDIRIWDDIYPCEFLSDDIARRRLYVLEEGREIVSAFALCDTNEGAAHVKWAQEQGKAVYLDRLGVNVEHLRRGIGSAALRQAIAMARALGAGYLRLFVVDSNAPAIRLYQKNGFAQAVGVYDEVIDGDLVLHEFGFEIDVGRPPA